MPHGTHPVDRSHGDHGALPASRWRSRQRRHLAFRCAALLSAIAAGSALAPNGEARKALSVRVRAPLSVVDGSSCAISVRASRSTAGMAVLQERRKRRWRTVSSASLKRRSATLRCKTSGRVGSTLRMRVLLRRAGRTLARSKTFGIRVVARARPPYRRYLDRLAANTYGSILASVEPSTGLPHDKIDASLLDIVPQLGMVRGIPYASTGPSASLDARPCRAAGCAHSGRWGLRLAYSIPAASFASYNIDSHGFDASSAVDLELWARGDQAGDRFEVVLWSNCAGGFPGRPASALIEVGTAWQRHTVPMADFAGYVTPASLCRLSLGFNDAIDPAGTVHVDGIRFQDAAGKSPWLAPDEETNVTTVGLYMASVVGARSLGLETTGGARKKLATTLTALESLPKYHGFPQTHNHVVSRTPSTGDTCISTVDSGNLAIGLILVRQRFPELAHRAGALLAAMDWAWLYDPAAGLPFGCRYPDGSASPFHYDYLMADSRLAHLLGIGAGGMPASSWGNLRRAHQPPRCASAGPLEPGWSGGGLFMAFLPGLFLRDRGELASSAAALVDEQICYARQIGTPEGAWGWSATAMPPNGAEYCGFGCQRDDVLVPHAPLLALGAHRRAVGPAFVVRTLQALERLGARSRFSDGINDFAWGFRSSVNWQTKEVATPTLMLDQAMAFLSIVNQATGGSLRAVACKDPLVRQGTDAIADYAGSCGRR
jgi:hypothetical protein